MKIAYKILIPVLVIATLALLVFAPILHVKLEGTALDMIGLSVPEYNSVYGTVQEIEQMDFTQSNAALQVGDEIAVNLVTDSLRLLPLDDTEET